MATQQSNNQNGMTHVRVWVNDIGLQACLYLMNVGLFVEHQGETNWYPPRAISKITKERSRMLS